MTELDGELTCSASGAPLSPHARRAVEAIVDQVQPGERRPRQASSLGVSWYCPADAAPLVESDGLLQCDKCNRVIPSGLVHELIELNPH